MCRPLSLQEVLVAFMRTMLVLGVPQAHADPVLADWWAWVAAEW